MNAVGLRRRRAPTLTLLFAAICACSLAVAGAAVFVVVELVTREHLDARLTTLVVLCAIAAPCCLRFAYVAGRDLREYRRWVRGDPGVASEWDEVRAARARR